MLEVPDSPKLYTTIYDNFKGVDYTNDASNIWKYRMAEGLNMAPDEAGQPWKRTGWEVAITKSQLMTAFQTATGQAATDISPQRVYYFELHSQDHMAYIANVRYTSQNTTYELRGVTFVIRKDTVENQTTHIVSEIDSIMCLKNASAVSADSVLQVDVNRCFFFEGNGTAGFYMFKRYESGDTTVNQLYIYTYEQIGVAPTTEEPIYGFTTRHVSPYVPTIIIARTPSGGDGTLFEGANMLTDFRRVRFYGDGSTKPYSLPTTTTDSTSFGVRIMNDDGTWADIPSNHTKYSWTPTQGEVIEGVQHYTGVTFTTAPPDSPITGEDNVEITYKSSGAIIDASTSDSVLVCSTGDLVSNRETRTSTTTVTHNIYQSGTTLGISRTNAYDTYTVSGTGTVMYIPTVTFTISAPSTYETQSTSGGTWSAWNGSPVSPSGTASGSVTIDPSADITLKKYVNGSWVTMELDEYSSTINYGSNTLNLTLNDISGWTYSSATPSVSTPTSSSRTTTTNNISTGYIYTKIKISSAYSEASHTEALSAAAEITVSGVSAAAASGSSGDLTISGAGAMQPDVSITGRTSYRKGGSYTETTVTTESRTTTTVYKYNISLGASTVEIDTNIPEVGAGMKAFMACSRATLFGSGILNAVFMTGSTSPAYTSRVWYSGVGDPTYFPDTNYIEAGSNDTNIMGMIRVGEYLGIIKQGANIDATIYLAYPTSYDDNTTYAIKQSITGVGAVSNGAFNIISDDSLFLSNEGIMAVSPDDTERQVKNRSYFINKPLTNEDNLSDAVSFVYDGMYLLCVPRYVDGVKTGVCYVLDGSQKTSWANEKTNLQFEAYFWDNIPAQCFARYSGKLWFADFKGNLCRFKEVDHSASYHDDYSATNTKCADWTGTTYEVEFDQTTYDAKTPVITEFWYDVSTWKNFTHSITAGCSVDLDTFLPLVDTSVSTHTFTYNNGWAYNGNSVSLSEYGITYGTPAPNTITVTLSATTPTLGQYGIAITGGIPNPWDKITIRNGVPIKARFATISDNDGATQYFKNMQKKGVVVSLLPKKETGATIYVKADEKDEIKTTIVKGQESELPSDVFIKKKIKKYKRLQFVVENNNYDETFGVSAITKTYTLGNFAKNRRT